MSLGGSKGSSRESRSVDIPAFLQPFVRQAAGTAGRSLRGMERLGPENLVSPLTDEQEAALSLARERAGGAGGFIPTAQSELLRTAQGVPISDFLPQDTLASLSGFGGDAFSPDIVARLMTTGVLPESSIQTLTDAQAAGLPTGTEALNIDPNISSFLPAASQAALARLTEQRAPVAASELDRVLEGEFIPAAARDTFASLTNQADPRNVDALLPILNRSIVPDSATGTIESLMASNVNLPPESIAALQSTARGDFLFGGQGFDQAVDAAMRAALPQIRSVFGSAGAGGATGGLAQTAVGQAAIDAFAGQFGAERGRQLSAADRLASLRLGAQDQDARQRLAAASTLADLGLDESRLALSAQDALEGQSLARGNQALTAAGSLANLGLSEQGVRLDAQDQFERQRLAGDQLAFGAADVLGNLGLAGRAQSIDAGSRLADIGLATRGQQQDAAATLANLGLMENEQGIRGAGLLGDLIGNERQRELSASGLLADIANTERGRSLTAAGLLPDAALLDVNLLDQVGSARQEQAEREGRAPLDFNQMLLAAALGGLPIESLLGQTATSRQRGFGFSL